MTKNEQIQVDYKIEEAENKIREQHNNLESKRWLGKKTYMPYDNSKFIAMVNHTSELINETKKED